MSLHRRISVLVVEAWRQDATTPLSHLIEKSYKRLCAVDAVGQLTDALSHLGSLVYDLVLVAGFEDAEGAEVVRRLELAGPSAAVIALPWPPTAREDREALSPRLRGLIDRIRKDTSVAVAGRPADPALRSVFRNSVDGILVVDARGRALFANPAAVRMIGCDEAELIGAPMGFPVRDAVVSDIEFGNGRVAEMQVVSIPWEGQTAHLATLRDITRRKQAERALVRLTEELRRANQRLKELAEVDPLTNLSNRRGLVTVMRELAPMLKSGALSALLIDCDDFKKVNDVHGHVAGDVVLRYVARRLRSVLRPTDRLARVGGDEFLVLLPGSSAADAVGVGERMRLAVQERPIPLTQGTEVLRVSVSIGVAGPCLHAQTLETLVERAETALRRSKTHGKDRVSAPGPQVARVAR
jgi:diguanylate cyclase (GGDEF)-like protein